MGRFLAPLAVLVVVVLGIAAARPGLESVAQEAIGAHPLIGAWVADTNADDPANPPSLFIFHDDGTFLQTEVDGSNAVGAWEETGPTTATLTAVILGGDETGGFGGSATVRASIAVDEAGDTFTAEYTLEFTEAGGMSSGELGPATATAERIMVEAMGTPTAGMDEAGGTPAAG